MLSRARAFSRAFGFAFLLIGCGLLAGCNSETADNGVFNSAKLPRVAGAKEITASPAVTIFTSPTSVAQTADAVDKALTEAGWQKYNVASAARAGDANMRTMTLKKGTQAVNVFITVAPAQGNATSVQYAALPLKTELPFAKDATEIEYSPDRPQLSLVTAQPAKDALEFYRKELGDRGWALWSAKTGTKQAAAGPPSAQALEPAVFAACRSQGIVPEEFVAALGGYGSWLVHFARAGRRERIVWNGREGKLVLQAALRSGGWEDLRDCPVPAADESGFVAAIATLMARADSPPG